MRAHPLRAIHIPADPNGEGAAGTFLLFDNASSSSKTQSSNLQALLDVLPIGLALVDRDGRELPVQADFAAAQLTLQAERSLVVARAQADGRFIFKIEPVRH